MTYAQAQADFLARNQIPESGAGLLEKYQGLIDECTEGYQWDYSEYRNELRVRDRIARVLADKSLQQFEEHRAFETAVERLDEAFKALAHKTWQIPTSAPWWHRVVLTRAGEPYAEFCRTNYGFEMEPIEG